MWTSSLEVCGWGAACVITNRPQSSQSRHTCVQPDSSSCQRFNSLTPLTRVYIQIRLEIYTTHIHAVQPPPEDCEVAGVGPKEGLRAGPCANLRPAQAQPPQAAGSLPPLGRFHAADLGPAKAFLRPTRLPPYPRQALAQPKVWWRVTNYQFDMKIRLSKAPYPYPSFPTLLSDPLGILFRAKGQERGQDVAHSGMPSIAQRANPENCKGGFGQKGCQA